jgi:hypothetical protein
MATGLLASSTARKDTSAASRSFTPRYRANCQPACSVKLGGRGRSAENPASSNSCSRSTSLEALGWFAFGWLHSERLSSRGDCRLVELVSNERNARKQADSTLRGALATVAFARAGSPQGRRRGAAPTAERTRRLTSLRQAGAVTKSLAMPLAPLSTAAPFRGTSRRIFGSGD